MRKINIRNTIILMVLSLIIIPVISHAESLFDMEPDMENIAAAIGMELFVSIHMTLFVIFSMLFEIIRKKWQKNRKTTK